MVVNVRLPKMLLCFRCRKTWLPRKVAVVRCPRCKSLHWFEPQPPRRGRPPKQKPVEKKTETAASAPQRRKRDTRG